MIRPAWQTTFGGNIDRLPSQGGRVSHFPDHRTAHIFFEAPPRGQISFPQESSTQAGNCSDCADGESKDTGFDSHGHHLETETCARGSLHTG